MAKNATFVKGKGCGNCQNKGFRGRIGIYELMVMTPKLRELAFENAPTQEVRKTAVNEGMSTLYDDGLRKVLNGITTLEEVFRVAKQVEE
jgi:type IV pilus assembly protein PilB